MGTCPWAVFFSVGDFVGTFGAVFFLNQPGAIQMNSTVKSYLWFLGFMAVTKIVVAPVAKQLNIPLVSDVLA